MKLIVLGATGGVGMEIVRQASERGHDVTALARKPDPLKKLRSRLAVIQGDLLDTSNLEGILEGNDAVLSGFGPRTPIAKSDGDLLRRFATSLTAAMRQARIRRVVLVSTAFLFKDAIIPPAALFGRLFFRDLVTDAAGMENILQQSNLDWTIARPPRLTDHPRTGRYRVRKGHLPRFGFTISRADVADFMIKAAEDQAYIKQIAGVSN